MFFYATICVPMFVWVIGLILAVVRWKQSPKKSGLVLVGLSIMLLGGVTDLLQYALSANLNVTMFQIFGIAKLLFDTLGWVLCIVAIFIPDKKEVEVK